MANHHDHSLYMSSIPHPSLASSQQEMRSVRPLAEVSRAHLSGMCKHSLMLLRNLGTPCRHKGWGTLARMTGTQKQRVLLERWRTWRVLRSVRTYEEVEESLVESQLLYWEIPLGYSPLQIRPPGNPQHCSSLLRTQLTAAHFSLHVLTHSKRKDPIGSWSYTEDSIGQSPWPNHLQGASPLAWAPVHWPEEQNSQCRLRPRWRSCPWQVCSGP